MKKNLLLGFLILFLLSTTAFAGLNGPKGDSEKPVVTNPKENKLSDEELIRMRGRVEELNNLDKSNLSNKEKKELKKDNKAIKQMERRHGGYIWVGGGTLLIIIIVILLLA